MAGEGSRKRKAREALVEEESGSQLPGFFSDDDLIFHPPVINACQAFDDSIYVPAEFRCPLTSAIMSDPVLLTNGQVVDMRCLENPIDALPDDLVGLLTGVEGLSASILGLKDALRSQIEQWPEAKRKAKLRWQLKMLSYSLDHQLASARELRFMADEGHPYAKAFADLGPSAVLELARPLLTSGVPTDYTLHEEILRTAALLSEHDPRNRELFLQHPAVVDIIIKSLRCGTPTATLAAMTLVHHITITITMTELGCRSELLVSSGIVRHLVELVQTDSISFQKHAVGALYELSLARENISKMVMEGVVDVISDLLPHRYLSHNIAVLLRRLSVDNAALDQLAESELIRDWLLETMSVAGLVRETKTCLVVALSRILLVSDSAVVAVYQHEAVHHSIGKIILNGTQRSKEAAEDILDCLNSEEAMVLIIAQISQNDSDQSSSSF